MVSSTTEYSKSCFLNVHCWQGACQPLVPWESHGRLSLWSECSQKLALCPSCTGCWGVPAPCRVHFQDTKITTKARTLGFYGIKAWSINNKQGKALSGSNKGCAWKGVAVRVASAGTADRRSETACDGVTGHSDLRGAFWRKGSRSWGEQTLKSSLRHALAAWETAKRPGQPEQMIGAERRSEGWRRARACGAWQGTGRCNTLSSCRGLRGEGTTLS